MFFRDKFKLGLQLLEPQVSYTLPEAGTHKAGHMRAPVCGSHTKFESELLPSCA